MRDSPIRDMRPELSVVVLCYRAGDGVTGVLDPLYDQLSKAGASFELVLVANYDPDDVDPTRAVVERWSSGRAGVTVIARPKQGAMGWDMRSGLEAARGELIVVIDGDGQNPPEDAVRMYQELKRTGADMMKGRRVARADGPYRRVLSQTYNALFRLVFGTRGLWDVNAKPKGLTRQAYERMDLKSDDWFIDAEMVLAAKRGGMRIEELPVVFRKNERRPSFVRLSAIWEFVVNIARHRLRLSR